MPSPSKAAEAQSIWGRRSEWYAAVILTAIAVVIHVVNLRNAGGLWRDEAAAVYLAQMPNFREIWKHLEHESFPLLLTTLLRGWSAVALGDDAGLRIFGLLVGLAVIGVLWWNAWRLSTAPPRLSLLLLALSPTMVRWGDSLRGYGLGVLFILLALGATWRVVRIPSTRNALLAMAVGVLAVQALYSNAFVLGAICLSGAVVAMRSKDFKRALLILSLGLPAALSLLPYLSVIKRADEWNVATQVALDLPRIWTVLQRALSEPGPWMFWLWAGSLLTAFLIGVWLIVRTQRAAKHEGARDVALFSLALMTTGTLASYAFLKLTNFPTETWYYLVWIGVMAVTVDALIARASRPWWSRVAYSGFVLTAGIALFPGLWERAHVRMTNVDLVAKHLSERVQESDLILIHPWFCGASFHRYYQGKAPWTTVPPLTDYGLQRLDLFKAQLQEEDPVGPVLERLETTMRNGGTVWLVGPFPFANPPQRPPSLPRPGEGPEGWRGAPYMMAYAMQTTYFLQMNGTQSAPVELPVAQPVNPFEDLPLRTISGWRQRF